MRLLLLSLISLAILSGIVLLIVDNGVEPVSSSDLTVASVMAGEDRGFDKADTIINFDFPRDHYASVWKLALAGRLDLQPVV